jgi:hypothetical protein
VSTKGDKKAEGEREVFSLFAKTMDWLVDDDLIQTRPEPEPDILYDGAYGKIAFELVENCAPDLAENRAFLKNGNGETLINTSDPTINRIRSKLKKSYETEFPVELLIYTNGRVATPNNMAVERIKSEIEFARQCPFRRAWYFGKQNEIFMVWEK